MTQDQGRISFVSPPGECGYLPGQTWSLRYEVDGRLTPGRYADRLTAGWRRFGHAVFRPECPTCRACQSLRVDVPNFRPSATQKRVWRQNHGELALAVGRPAVTDEKLELYDRFHAFQADFKGWPEKGGRSAAEYAASFVDNPFATEEWCYRLGGELVGVGYVDRLPGVGLSAIYFFYDPDRRPRSPGVFNVLSVLAAAAADRLPHVYLGYYVDGCRSLGYKANYRPNEVLGPGGRWQPFRA